jgi:colanic acid biosynthesis glycosyl transferase WcaI
MKILIITLYYKPDPGASSVIISQLSRELVNLGHKVTVVTGFPHYAENVMEKKYRGKIFTTENLDSIKIVRTYLYTSPHKANFMVRLLNYVSFNILSTLAGLFSGLQDLIFAPSPPLTVGLSAAFIGFFKRIPYVYNVQDINPDVLIKLGILRNRLFILFAKSLEKFVYNSAEQITVLSEGFRDNLLAKSVPPQKLTIIPNFIDPDFVKPLPRENEFARQHNLGGRYVVLYAGNLGHSQNLEDLLECAKLMSSEKDLVFLIVGHGSRKPFLEDYARELNLENVLFVPFQPLEMMPEIYASADLSLVTLKQGIALDSVPSKIYTIMASARPVLAAVDPGSDAWKLVENAGCGLCLDPESPTALREAIDYLRERPDLSSAMGQRGRQYVLDHHTSTLIGQEYQELFMRIVHENKH